MAPPSTVSVMLVLTLALVACGDDTISQGGQTGTGGTASTMTSGGGGSGGADGPGGSGLSCWQCCCTSNGVVACETPQQDAPTETCSIECAACEDRTVERLQQLRTNSIEFLARKT